MDKVDRIFPEDLPAALGPYTPVTTVGDLIFVSGQVPINPKTNEIDQKSIEGQTHQVMKNIGTALEGADSNFSQVAKVTILLTDMSNFSKVNEVYGSYFEKNKYPARVCYSVVGLPKGSLVEMDATATRCPVGDSIKKKFKNS